MKLTAAGSAARVLRREKRVALFQKPVRHFCLDKLKFAILVLICGKAHGDEKAIDRGGGAAHTLRCFEQEKLFRSKGIAARDGFLPT